MKAPWAIPCIIIILLLSAGIVSAQTAPSTETITKGTVVSGTFPTSIETSDDNRLVRDEQLINTTDSKDYPDTETLNSHPTILGTFPSSIEADDNDFLQRGEKSVTQYANYTPGTQTIVKGSQTAGSFPTCIQISDDTRCTWQEANQAGAAGIAFDAAVEALRTTTANPYSWTHTPVGTPRGIAITAIHGVDVESYITSIKYGTSSCTSGSGVGGISVTGIVVGFDDAGELGRSEIYYIGTGIPTGNAQVCVAFTLATDVDYQFVSLSYTANADTSVIDSDAWNGDTANPTTASHGKLVFGGLEALGLEALYTGRISPPANACSGSSGCTLVFAEDWGSYGASVDRQTTRGSTDEVMGYTAATDDVGLAAIAFTDAGAADFELEVKFSWSGVPISGIAWRLYIEGREGASNPEQLNIRYYNADETLDSTIRCSITSTTETEYDCGDISSFIDTGTPDIQLVDATQSGDTTQSTVDLDRIRIQVNSTAYVFDIIQYDWTGTLPTVDFLILNARGNRTNDSEIVLIQAWDWTDSDYNTLFGVDQSAETLFTVNLNTTCGAPTDDCHMQSGNVRIRVYEPTQDSVQTIISFDELWVRILDQDYQLEIRYDWSGLGVNDTQLKVEAQRTNDTETINIQVLTPPSTWTTRLAVTTDTDTTQIYTMSDPEFNTGSPSVRFMDAGGVAGNQTRLAIDLLIMESIGGGPAPSTSSAGGGFIIALMLGVPLIILILVLVTGSREL